MHHAQRYQRRMARAYQKKVRPRNLAPDDLVLRAIHLPDAHGKFRPNWCYPFVIKQIYSEGTEILEDMDHAKQLELVNSCYLNNYY